MNIFRKKLIEGLKLKIQTEIEMMTQTEMVRTNYSTPEDIEKDILDHAKDLGYNYELDDHLTGFALKATQIEIWQYWIDNIIPNFDLRCQISKGADYWMQELGKCKKSAYYFATKYVTVNDQPFTTMMSEEQFNEMHDRFLNNHTGPF